MKRFLKRRILLSLSLLAVMAPALAAQDDPSEIPLGDVARSLRKKNPPAQAVIDDDNFPRVMEQAESRHAPSPFRLLMAGEDRGFHVAAPDATCSLTFTAGAKSLLSSAYAQIDLPPDDMQRLEGPATIEGDALIVPLYNRTEWHVSEISVALTVVKKNGARDLSGNPVAEHEVRPEKKPDVTVIYRMRSAAPPFMTTVFSTRVKVEVAADEEWHWALVQARGYPPQSYVAFRHTSSEGVEQRATQDNLNQNGLVSASSLQSTVPDATPSPALAAPTNAAAMAPGSQ